MKTKVHKIEGYWYSEYAPQYPKPIPNELNEEEALLIYNKIIEKEKQAKKIYYKGLSFSRITNEILGNVEYELNDWKWTGDLAEHYVLTHKVKPSDEFLKFINN